MTRAALFFAIAGIPIKVLGIPGVRDAAHYFDFRGCIDGVNVTDRVDSFLQAVAHGSTTCSAYGLVLKGDDAYIEATPWEFGGDSTFEMVLRLEAPNWLAIFFDFLDTTYQNQVALAGFYDESNDGASFISNDDQDRVKTVLSPQFVTYGRFVHVVLVLESSEARLYKNGELMNRTINSSPPMLTKRKSHYIGGQTPSYMQKCCKKDIRERRNATSGRITGTYSFMRTYDLALTSNEITALASNVSGLLDLTPAPTVSPFPTESPTRAPVFRPTPTPTVSCFAGSYLIDNGATCTACLAGQYSTVALALACDACPVGKFNTLPGSIDCFDCPPGKLSSDTFTVNHPHSRIVRPPRRECLKYHALYFHLFAQIFTLFQYFFFSIAVL